MHKIREDSPAHKDGKLRKGTHVLAINNKTVKGLTHKQIVAILKVGVFHQNSPFTYDNLICL